MAFSDADLIGRVRQSGDPNAFGELVRRHQSAVRGFLTKMTRGNTAQADDLAQETFLRAWRKLEAYRGESSFLSWLFSIAVNEFRGRMRRERRRAELEEPAPATEAAEGLPAPGLRLDVNDALLRLTPAERAAIVLCCQNGLTHEEAAQVLDCALGTVKTNILRGKAKLRLWLSV